MTLLEIVQQAGIQPKWVASTAGGEYHSPCPQCGGTDRFFIQPNRQMNKCIGSYYCRRCGIHGDTIQFARQFLNYSFYEATQLVKATFNPKFSLSYINSHCAARPVSLRSPSTKWINAATLLISDAHERLLCKTDTLQVLADRGIPLNAVKRYKLGWSEKSHFFSRSSWGLDEQCKENGEPRFLWIPKGLIIPALDLSGNVLRLKVRRYDWKEGDSLPKYVAISGSMNGLTLIGSKHSTMIVVESELDAYAIDYVANTFAYVVAVGSNMKNPDNVTDRIARNVKTLLICHDNDAAGNKMLDKWKRLYAHARAYPTPFGKDIGEAISAGLDIRSWISENYSN